MLSRGQRAAVAAGALGALLAGGCVEEGCPKMPSPAPLPPTASPAQPEPRAAQAPPAAPSSQRPPRAPSPQAPPAPSPHAPARASGDPLTL